MNCTIKRQSNKGGLLFCQENAKGALGAGSKAMEEVESMMPTPRTKSASVASGSEHSVGIARGKKRHVGRPRPAADRDRLEPQGTACTRQEGQEGTRGAQTSGRVRAGTVHCRRMQAHARPARAMRRPEGAGDKETWGGERGGRGESAGGTAELLVGERATEPQGAVLESGLVAVGHIRLGYRIAWAAPLAVRGRRGGARARGGK